MSWVGPILLYRYILMYASGFVKPIYKHFSGTVKGRPTFPKLHSLKIERKQIENKNDH